MSHPPSPHLPRALIEWDGDHNPYSPQFGDIYRPRGSQAARAQAEHVFLEGNGLPHRWQGLSQFVILETGLGLCTNFLATWHAWRQDPQRSTRLIYIGLEGWLPSAQDIVRAQQAQPWLGLAQTLSTRWPAPLRNFHVIDLDDGQVRLLLCLGDIRHTWPRLVAQVDAFYLDGFAPSRNPDMWDPALLRHMARLASPDATASTWSAARSVRDALSRVGFQVDIAPGSGAKRHMSTARFRPAFQASPPPGRRANRLSSPRLRGETAIPNQRSFDAVVVGAGLAGAAIAAALARRGLSVQVLSQGASAADAASGNPAGLYHGTWHRSDGKHASLLRASALFAHHKYQLLVSTGRVTGLCEGLARLGESPNPLDPTPPPQYAQWLEASDVAKWTHTQASQGAWLYAQGGWVDPRQVVLHDLNHTGIHVHNGVTINRIERLHDTQGPRWVLKDSCNQELSRCTVLVLANGIGISRILGPWGWDNTMAEVVRGQVSWLQDRVAVAHPMAGEGYALRLSEELVMCGASSQTQDDDLSVRQQDHEYNLQRFQGLTGSAAQISDITGGRTAFRLNTWDKLPLVGPWPDVMGSIPHRTDQARMWPRLDGLYVMAGLGGRGLTWAPLMSELLAAWITAEPLPLESDLVDAVDPARWRVKSARQASALKPHGAHP